MKIILLIDAWNEVQPALSIQKLIFLALLLYEPETPGLNRQLDMAEFHQKLP